jgi:hypothetical protein
VGYPSCFWKVGVQQSCSYTKTKQNYRMNKYGSQQFIFGLNDIKKQIQVIYKINIYICIYYYVRYRPKDLEKTAKISTAKIIQVSNFVVGGVGRQRELDRTIFARRRNRKCYRILRTEQFTFISVYHLQRTYNYRYQCHTSHIT